MSFVPRYTGPPRSRDDYKQSSDVLVAQNEAMPHFSTQPYHLRVRWQQAQQQPVLDRLWMRPLLAEGQQAPVLDNSNSYIYQRRGPKNPYPWQ